MDTTRIKYTPYNGDYSNKEKVMAEATMNEDQFNELVYMTGNYLATRQALKLSRKANAAMVLCVAGGFYAGVRAHIWWTRQKQIAKTLAEQGK